jgi:outer membrane protein OmpA-like peptidoglycan-associated protein
VLREAPRDVVRAGESLERAYRFAGYLGSSEDASHYAYLSQRYSDIARQNSELMQSQQVAAQLAIEQARLSRTLQDAKQFDLQNEGVRSDDDLISMATDETDRGLVMTLGDVLFKAASSELSPSANRTLLKLARFLQLNPARKVRIEGYTDSRGVASDNLELSRLRAQSVAHFLQELGINPIRMEVVGYGEQHPISENASARGRAQNRRVEVLFSDEHGQLSELR